MKENIYNLYNSFINDNFTLDDNWYRNNVSLENLTDFFELNGHYDGFVCNNIEIFSELMKNNKKLYSSFETFVIAINNFKSSLVMVRLTENENIKSLIRIYCALNNLDYDDVMIKIVSNKQNSESLKIYFNDINKYSVLTNNEELILFNRLNNGDKNAREMLISSNLRLVVKIARKYSNDVHELLDMIQNGNIALVRAVDKFDLKFNVKFVTFAYKYIDSYLKNFVEKKQSVLRMPAKDFKIYNNILKFQESYLLENGKNPSIEEISNNLNINKKLISSLLMYPEEIISYEEIPDDIKEEIDVDEVQEDRVLDKLESDEVWEILDNLDKFSDRNKEIIKYLFGKIDGKMHAHREAAEKYNLSYVRISQIEEDAINKLKKALIKKEEAAKRNLSYHEEKNHYYITMPTPDVNMEHIENLKFNKTNDIPGEVILYINEKFSPNPGLQECVTTLKKFTDKFWDDYVGDTNQFYTKLIETNDLIQNYLNVLMKENNYTEKVLNNDRLLFLLDIYSVVKDEQPEILDEYSDMDDSLKIYLKDIGRKPVLSKEEEVELFQKYKNGDLTAKNKLIEHNLRYVVTIAKRYANSKTMDLLDLIEEGNIGLIEAIEKFDYTKGYKLSTYATWWIRQKIQLALYQNYSLIRVPKDIRELYFKLIAFENNLDSPSDERLAELLNVSVDKVKEIKNIPMYVESINAPISANEDSIEFGELIKDDYNLQDEAENNLSINELWRFILNIGLKRKELEVIKLRYGYYNNKIYSRSEVAEKLNFSYERVRVLEKLTLRKIRSAYIHKEAKENALRRVNLDTNKSVQFDIVQIAKNPELNKNVDSLVNYTQAWYTKDVKLQSVYEYLSEYTEWEIEYGLKQLPVKDLNLLYMVYGKDLKNPDYAFKITTDYVSYIYNVISPKLENIIINKYNLSEEELKQRKRLTLINTLKNVYESLGDLTAKENVFVSTMCRIKAKKEGENGRN